MMNVEIDGAKVELDEAIVEFPKPVREHIVFDDFLVVRLEVTRDNHLFTNRNVIAIQSDGSIRWIIPEAKEAQGRIRPYSGIRVSDDGELWATSFGGTAYRLDKDDGSHLEKKFVK